MTRFTTTLLILCWLLAPAAQASGLTVELKLPPLYTPADFPPEKEFTVVVQVDKTRLTVKKTLNGTFANDRWTASAPITVDIPDVAPGAHRVDAYVRDDFMIPYGLSGTGQVAGDGKVTIQSFNTLARMWVENPKQKGYQCKQPVPCRIDVDGAPEDVASTAFLASFQKNAGRLDSLPRWIALDPTRTHRLKLSLQDGRHTEIEIKPSDFQSEGEPTIPQIVVPYPDDVSKATFAAPDQTKRTNTKDVAPMTPWKGTSSD